MRFHDQFNILGSVNFFQQRLVFNVNYLKLNVKLQIIHKKEHTPQNTQRYEQMRVDTSMTANLFPTFIDLTMRSREQQQKTKQ